MVATTKAPKRNVELTEREIKIMKKNEAGVLRHSNEDKRGDEDDAENSERSQFEQRETCREPALQAQYQPLRTNESEAELLQYYASAQSSVFPPGSAMAQMALRQNQGEESGMGSLHSGEEIAPLNPQAQSTTVQASQRFQPTAEGRRSATLQSIFEDYQPTLHRQETALGTGVEIDRQGNEGVPHEGQMEGPDPLPATVEHESSGQTLSEFPFFFDGYAAWVCRHCSHLPAYYRGGNYVWQSAQPPPNPFVDMHLRTCPGLNPNLLPLPVQAQLARQIEQRSGALGMMQQTFGGPGRRESIQTLDRALPSWQERGQTAELPDPPGRSPQTSNAYRQERPSSQGYMQSVPHPRDTSGAFSAEGMGVSYSFQPQYQSQGGPGTHFSPPFRTETTQSSLPSQLPTASSPKPRRRKTGKGKGITPKGRQTDDVTYRSSLEFLTKKSQSLARPQIEGSDIGQSLIEQSDATLLTDYFYHMMKQLVVCRFSESDRKTRGGKRENVNLGYGGLQCIHCIRAQSARKFYWSTVDRLANSFAEIPAHVMKCKHCPDNVKDALLILKGRHPEQMQSLPRGSQKVFFRRMWRRLHDGDGDASVVSGSISVATTRQSEAIARRRSRQSIDPPAGGSMVRSPAVPSGTAASMLSRSSMESHGVCFPASSSSASATTSVGILPQASRVLLAIHEDKDWLSDMDCFVRNNIEVFSSNPLDVENAAADRKYPIKLGQVGIRCIHCASSTGGARGAAVAYPYSISGIYESVREFQRLHLEHCPHLPAELKETSKRLGSGASSLSSVLRRYYVQAARALGLYDTTDSGIKVGATPVPMSTSGFQPPAAGVDIDRKRRADYVDSSKEPQSKRLRTSETDSRSGRFFEVPTYDQAAGFRNVPKPEAPSKKRDSDARGEDAPEGPFPI
ncbi:hypothetical protein THAOC_09315 [Thalassiosira oceanica]|uniref:Uncharacterized protein n=1 Tax=Thalassiosira oceanica TaxID=159749 RepID=K0TFX5_THAOC|nr:hypothetical protein THAOC_09315 [Thalassiosira oceanica]|mmetsp:Transcript_18851/g.42665  ORF Transcript_18851/g.42665 Transcript_18851/m.42665 type:complete len:908 (-) Transcript_18851:125-2848(-)|eukprot:EJK69432.1 hypothetical protein THAOC_09315 [Thalassiosira oceanica]